MTTKKNRMSVCTLKNPHEQSILDKSMEVLMVQDVASIEQLIKYCKFKNLGDVSEDLLWKVLWCKSNLQLSYIPKFHALRWEGGVYRDKSWHWEIR